VAIDEQGDGGGSGERDGDGSGEGTQIRDKRPYRYVVRCQENEDVSLREGFFCPVSRTMPGALSY
jgi:hypothetical protein